MQIKDLKQDKRNFRKHNQQNLDLIKKSVSEVGLGRSVVIDNENEIVCGNGLVSTLDKNTPIKVIETDGSELVVVKRTDLNTNDEKRKQLAIMDNSTSDSSEFDLESLQADFDVEQLQDWGLDVEFESLEEQNDKSASLNEKFIVCPFSVLNAKTGEWQQRKKYWLNKGIKSEIGRGKFYEALGKLQRIKKSATENMIKNSVTAETSIFDPVLCEIAYTWFSKENDFILDPFAGGSVRGIVASELSRNYLGLELRKEQVEANIVNANEICKEYIPTWKIGDSNKTLDFLEDEKFDMCLSCPPYADLEVYSDNPDDLSNMDYEQFINTYQSIISKIFKKLKNNTFVVWVIGEVRNKKGNYYNFVGDTIKCFLNAGFNYYNEIILEMMFGTAMLRVNKTFQSGRKVVKVHQNVLVFVKGDGKQAAKRLGDVEVKELNIQDEAL